MFCRIIAATLLLLGFVATSQAAPDYDDWRASGKGGAVVAGGREATAAGIAILKSGGNAADAAVATILALTVTDSTQVCFGGEVPIMIYDAKRQTIEVFVGQGAAPRLATREYFAGRGGIPGHGIEPAAVPGLLDACLTALDRAGTKRFADVVTPALALLDRHEDAWHADLAATLRRIVAAESQSKDRSRGLRLAADFFYRGPIAEELSAWSEANGGLIRTSDLATHVTRIDDPLSVEYHGHRVYKGGVWTQGPYLLEALQLLEPLELPKLGHNQPQTVHLTLEAMKLALADRDVYYADPLFADVPIDELLAPKYAELRRGLIDPAKASLVQRPGDPRRGKALLDEVATRGTGGPANDTTTCVVADAQGNVVAATPSGWSGVLCEPLGIWMGTRLQSFNTWQGHPNCIEPGKRPRITLSPTIVTKDDRPVLAVSVAGGDGQDQAGIQLVLNSIDFGLDPAESVIAPRFGTHHHLGSFRQTPPELGSVVLNEAAGAELASELTARGHRVSTAKKNLWTPTAIAIDPTTGQMQAAGDPQSNRHAAALP